LSRQAQLGNLASNLLTNGRGKRQGVIKGFYEVCQLIKGAKLSEAGLSAFLYSTCGKALRISSTVSS
jgi:hypothetical protein